MPVYLRVYNGGNIIAGRINGDGERYVSDEIGNGEVFVGSFNRGRLECADGTYVTYTDTSFNVYLGNFINGRLDGAVTLYVYSDPSTLTPEEKAIDGNCIDRTRNVRLIHASNNDTQLPCVKHSLIYSNGNLTGLVSETNVNVLLNVSRRLLAGRWIFDGFTVAEV